MQRKACSSVLPHDARTTLVFHLICCAVSHRAFDVALLNTKFPLRIYFTVFRVDSVFINDVAENERCVHLSFPATLFIVRAHDVKCTCALHILCFIFGVGTLQKKHTCNARLILGRFVAQKSKPWYNFPHHNVFTPKTLSLTLFSTVTL